MKGQYSMKHYEANEVPEMYRKNLKKNFIENVKIAVAAILMSAILVAIFVVFN